MISIFVWTSRLNFEMKWMKIEILKQKLAFDKYLVSLLFNLRAKEIMYDINFVLLSFTCLFLTFDWLDNTDWTYLPKFYHFPFLTAQPEDMTLTVQKSESILKKFRKFKFRQFGVSLPANKHEVTYKTFLDRWRLLTKQLFSKTIVNFGWKRLRFGFQVSTELR